MERSESELLLAICVDNTDYELSLERRKVYPVIPDKAANETNYVRLVDETGEDYLFPASRFVFVTVPRTVEEALLAEAA